MAAVLFSCSTLIPLSAAAAPATAAERVTPSALLEQLRVEAPSSAAFDQTLFPENEDLDGDGCDTRQEVLIQESEVPATVGEGCDVTAGQWNSDYDYVLHVDPAAVTVEHLVTLREAWVSGAWAWTDDQRAGFANDLDDDRTLMVMTAGLAVARGDQDPASWLPPAPHQHIQCGYIMEWIAVKWRWNLSVDPAEKTALEKSITACGSGWDTPLPAAPAVGRPADPPLPSAVPVYRFWSPVFQGHFFTTSTAERDQIIARWPSTWTYEGQRYTAFTTQVAGTIPLYRFWSSAYAGHFYTADPSEKDAVIARWSNVWKFEGVAYYVYPADSTQPGTAPVARFWSPSAAHHFYTADAAERQGVISRWWRVWTFEGDSFRVPASGIPASTPQQPTQPQQPSQPTQPTQPGNPGDTKNCSDFPNYAAAKTWFDTYYPLYGDIARLDADNNGIPCESLPGAPR